MIVCRRIERFDPSGCALRSEGTHGAGHRLEPGHRLCARARARAGGPGFGGAPADPNVHGISDLVERVVGAIAGPVVLFAQSMGGVIALQAALRRPESVRGLVLAVTSGGIDMAGLGAVDWRARFAAQNPGLPRWFVDEREDLTARLPLIRAPALLLWGDADPMSPVAAGQRLAALLPDAELVVVEGGTHDLAYGRATNVPLTSSDTSGGWVNSSATFFDAICVGRPSISRVTGSES